MPGFPAREICDKFTLAVVRRGVGHFSTVMQRWLQKEGTLHPSFFLLLLPFQLPPLTPHANRPHTPARIPTHIQPLRCSVFARFLICAYMWPQIVSCLAALSLWVDWGMDDRIPTFEASQADSQFLAFFPYPDQGSKMPMAIPLFFFSSTSFPSFLCSKKWPVIQSWPKNQGGILLGVILGKIFLLFKRKHLEVDPFFSDLDTGMMCDIWCSGSYHVTMRGANLKVGWKDWG